MVKANVRELVLQSPKPVNIDLQAGIDAQAVRNEITIDGIQAAHRLAAHRVFELTWEGSDRSPYGTVILGKEIGVTQHGTVDDPEGKHIGTYERIDDGKGAKDGKHKMIIYLYPEEGDTETN